MKTKEIKNFELLDESLNEAIKFAKGKPAKVKVEELRIQTTGSDIKEARHILNVSQPQFARLMAVSSETVKKWEQGKNPIPAAVGYWAESLKVHPAPTKRLLFEVIGNISKRTTRLVGHS